MSDYSIHPFSDGNGSLFLSDDRSASFKLAPSSQGYNKYEVQLSEKVHGQEVHIVGSCIDPDKAKDACRIWVEERRIATCFRREKVPVSNDWDV